jgi:putative glycosyltransferase (TIGR04372 family)
VSLKFIYKNYQDVKKGGFKTLLKKIKIFIIFLSCFINPFYYLAAIFFLFCMLIRPFFIVRWDILKSSRIGHFSANTEIYCCKIEAGINKPKKKFVDLFCFDKEICNQQLAKMWKRKLNILPRFILMPIINLNKIIIKIFDSVNYFVHLDESIYSINEPKKLKKISTHRDLFNLIPITKPHINFTKKEIQKGEKYLNSLGIDKDAKIICLVVRDSAYQEKYLNSADFDTRHNDYRNHDISNFLLAAEELTKRGYWVFRMGKAVNKKIKTFNPKIIDYANLKIRNDFLDIYLSYKCKFCIRTSGFGGVPQIFRRPTLIIGGGPLADLVANGQRDMHLLQHYFSQEKNKKLTLSEIFDLGISTIRTSKGYDDLKIKIIHSSPEEIKDTVMEMVDSVEGRWKDKSNIKMLQDSFNRIFKKNLISNNLRYLFGKTNLWQSSSFLNKNSWWIK